MSYSSISPVFTFHALQSSLTSLHHLQVYKTLVGLFILYQQSNLSPELPIYVRSSSPALWYNFVAIIHALAP